MNNKRFIIHVDYQPMKPRLRARLLRWGKLAAGLLRRLALLGIVGAIYCAKLLFEFCYHTGRLVLVTATTAAKFTLQQIRRTRQLTPHRLKILLGQELRGTLAIFLIFCLIAGGVLQGLKVLATGLALKDSITNATMLGSQQLEQAQQALSNKNLSGAENQFTRALQTFRSANQQLADAGTLINQLGNLLPQKQAGQNVINAATLISQGGQHMIDFYQQAEQVSVTPQGLSSQQNIPALFTTLNNDLQQATQEIAQASADVAQIDPAAVPASQKDTFTKLQTQLLILNTSLQNFSGLFSVLQTILLGDKNILFIFENNDELRATGGFIGSYGAMELNNGAVNRMTISSIYDLDGQLKDKIMPPSPMINVNDRWYMRDSNWFADFPTSAQKISDFYEKEGGSTPDLVIAITPQVISDLLTLTGPITVPQFNLTLNTDNFLDETQANTGTNPSDPLNKPKQLLADFFPLLLQQLHALNGGQLANMLLILQNDLSSKQIVLYARDSTLEHAFLSYNWGGSINTTDRDYLEIVGSNLGGTKTDVHIQQQYSLQTAIAADGSITDTLTIVRTNPLPTNLADMTNTSFLRVYVPQGSQLLSSSGFDYLNLPALDPSQYEIDPDVYNWERLAEKNAATGMMTGLETGKTFFGNWSILKGGDTKTITLTYRLPFTLANPDRYSLLVQKQIGSQPATLNWTLQFPSRQIDWKNFNADTLDIDSLTSETSLTQDEFYGLVLEKR